jgi:hypothetical protein
MRVEANPTLTLRRDGSVVFETTAQQYLMYSASLRAGPAAKMRGEWNALAEGARVGVITVGQPWIYGLKGARQALGIGIGDRVRIRFDTWTREAEVSVVGRR